MSTHARIEALIKANDVVLFMKGTRRSPSCGFSASVVSILDEFLEEYETVNVLADEEIRAGIKEFSSWPTIPQLYVQGEFVGGADIIKEMFGGGELAGVLGVTMKDSPTPTVTVTERAVDALKRFAGDTTEALSVRLQIDASFRYGMDFDDPRPGDVTIEGPGFTLLLDRSSARRADGMTIDFLEQAGGGGFKMENPNEPPKMRTIDPHALKGWMDAGKPVEILDVRTAEERATAQIAGTRFVDEEAKNLIEAFDRDTVLVVYCHHGERSEQAAQHFLRRGFKHVYNLVGGIEAWSQQVDPSVPRY